MGIIVDLGVGGSIPLAHLFLQRNSSESDNAKYMNRLISINRILDIPAKYRDTPVSQLFLLRE